MLLIITGSIDGTSDLVLKKLGTKAFRLNFDLFSEYNFCLSPDGWSIENPTGHKITSDTATALWWWKAFNYTAHDEPFINEELKYIFRELLNWARSRGMLKANPPDFHNRLGKIGILSVAKKYFAIPSTTITWGFTSPPPITNAVAKSLASGLTTTNKALFTTAVDTQRLDPKFPWYLQEKINASADTTILIVGKHKFCFDRDRSGLTGLDWRNEQDFTCIKEEWIPQELSQDQDAAVNAFCEEIGVSWGRLDLLRLEDGSLVFLEYNANGQWVFLDYHNKYGLVDTVIDYLTTT